MNKLLARVMDFIWYKDHFIGLLLLPFGMIFFDVVRFRRYLYRIGVFRKKTLPVPVVVVGNITVGGTGKTPLVIWLANYLKQQGYKPGIISRGYGGQATKWPQRVDADSDPLLVGDEALMIANNTNCPMAVGPHRVAAAQYLLVNSDCNVILSDDGLQHYALNRDFEIAVVDGLRRFGNGYCLPAGPLREPISRIREVDMVICNGPAEEDFEYSMQVHGDTAVNLLNGEQASLSSFSGRSCHAIAGIGNPQRFFQLLLDADVTFDTRIFADHYHYQQGDIDFNDEKPVLMTEKDAVKCVSIAQQNYWFVPVQAIPEQAFIDQFNRLFSEKLAEK